jgi:hypothetical protein
MANNCLQTQLKATVQNNNLPKLGEFRFSCIGEVTRLGVSKGKTINIYDTNRNLLGTINGGSYPQGSNTLLSTFGITGLKEIIVSNKYDLNWYEIEKSNTAPIIPLSTFAFSPDIIEFKGVFQYSDFEALRGKVHLTHFYTKVGSYGNADIAPLATCTALKEISLASNDYGVIGDVAAFSGLSALKVLIVAGNRLHGDISQLPQTITFFSASVCGDEGGYKWTSRTGNGLPIGSTTGCEMGNYIDTMLINQATLNWSGISANDKIINVVGTRTSASDAAVTTLKGMGITVRVNGTNL